MTCVAAGISLHRELVPQGLGIGSVTPSEAFAHTACPALHSVGLSPPPWVGVGGAWSKDPSSLQGHAGCKHRCHSRPGFLHRRSEQSAHGHERARGKHFWLRLFLRAEVVGLSSFPFCVSCFFPFLASPGSRVPFPFICRWYSSGPFLSLLGQRENTISCPIPQPHADFPFSLVTLWGGGRGRRLPCLLRSRCFSSVLPADGSRPSLPSLSLDSPPCLSWSVFWVERPHRSQPF